MLNSNLTVLKPNDSVDAILKKANLGWEVVQRDLFAEFEGKKVNAGRKALMRADTGDVLTVTGPNWKPIQNRAMVEFFKTFADEGGATIESVRTLRGGRGLFATLDIKADFELDGHDKVKGLIGIASFHQVGNATTMMSMSSRLVCENQLENFFKKSDAKYRQNHLSEFDFQAARDTVTAAKETLMKFAAEAKALKKFKMSEIEVLKLFASHFVKEEGLHLEGLVNRMQNEEREQPLPVRQLMHSYAKAPGASPGDAWGALNAVTHWADHVAGTSADARFNRATFGANARLKQAVKAELLEMV